MDGGTGGIDLEAMADIREIYESLSAIQTARSALLSMVLCAPFTVKVPALGMESNDELNLLIETYWMPWLYDVYDHIKMFGVVPFYMEQVSGTVHSIPRVPPMGSGYSEPFLDNKQRVRWRWQWTRGAGVKSTTQFHWIVEKNAPTIDGRYRSVISTLLPAFRTVRILRRSLEYAAHHRARRPYIFEYDPPRQTGGDDVMTTLEAFGERIAGTVVEAEESLRGKRLKVRTDAFFNALLSAHAHNRRVALPQSSMRALHSDRQQDADALDDPGVSNRAFPLRPHFKYVKPADPGVVAELDRYERQLNTQAAAVMDFPLEMIETANAGRAVNIEGNRQFLNNRIRETVAFFRRIIRRAFLLAYGDAIQEGLDVAAAAAEKARQYRHRRRWAAPEYQPHRYLRQMAVNEVQVNMVCTPVVNSAQLRQLWVDGMMSKEAAAHQIFHKLLLPEELIEVTPDAPPLRPNGKSHSAGPKQQPKADATMHGQMVPRETRRRVQPVGDSAADSTNE